MELEAHKTADRLSEVGVQKEALERDVATMKTENDRLRFLLVMLFCNIPMICPRKGFFFALPWLKFFAQ